MNRWSDAYISGLEDLKQAGGDVSKIGSVASIFVSRIDVAVDKRLEKLGDKKLADRLTRKGGNRQRKTRLCSLQALFSGPRWQSLAKAGARTQRLLWASTSTKNPAYKDTMYVEALIGRDTVDTIPPATMDAFRDHGEAEPDAIEQDMRGRPRRNRRTGESRHFPEGGYGRAGQGRRAAVRGRVRQAVRHHRAARRTLLEGDHPRLEIAPGSPEMKAACDAEMEVWRKGGRIRRLWAGDTSLWSGTDEGKWVGWLDIVEQELADFDRLTAFAEKVKQGGFTDVVLLGMGGSSLGPEVLGETFGPQAGWPRFHMLDSTDPAQIRAIEQAIDLGKTLFIVSSKSGSTLEPNIFMDYFLDRVGMVEGKDKAGEHFIAVTDPGSPLERRANQLHFAHVFHGVPTIGGRYSVLSKFGLVPAAAMGLDVRRLLETTQTMQRSCGADVPPSENPGVQLGIAMGVAATRFGRDKVTIIASPGIADLGAWLEQLLAESTGKQGRGLIPLAGEPLTVPECYGNDRFFAYLELDGQVDPPQRRGGGGAGAGRPSGRADQREGYLAHRPGILPLGDRHRRRRVDHRHRPVQPAGCRGEQGQDARADRRAMRNRIACPKRRRCSARMDWLSMPIRATPLELGRHNTLTGYLKSHFGRVHGRRESRRLRGAARLYRTQ